MFHTRQLFVSLLLPLKRPKRTFYTVTTFVLPSSSFDASGPKRKEEGGRETGERKKKKEEYFFLPLFPGSWIYSSTLFPFELCGRFTKGQEQSFQYYLS